MVLLLVLHCEVPGEGSPVVEVGVELGQVDNRCRLVGEDLAGNSRGWTFEVQGHWLTVLILLWDDLKFNDLAQIGVIFDFEG